MLEVRPFSIRDKRFVEILARNNRDDDSLHDSALADVRAVKAGGADALLRCVRRSDWADAALESLAVTEEEMAAARREVSESFLTAVSLARVNLRKFHEYQRRRGYLHDDGDGVRLSRRVIPMGRVGIVCRRSFADLLMCAVPAQVAGVADLACAAAPAADGRIDPHFLATAKTLGITEVYRMGGAHAVAAMAYGAGPVRRVDKVVGPGGPLAGVAKRLLSDRVGVDLADGGSELAVVADAGSNARFIAADLLSQAGRGGAGDAMVLFSADRMLAEAVRIEIDRMTETLPDGNAVRDALRDGGALFVCRSLAEALAAANAMAPARLVLSTADNEAALADIDNAGSVFLGPWSGEGLGDALIGVNQLFPAAGAARFASGLGVDDFVREMTLVDYTPARLAKTGRHMTLLAEAEGLAARAGAVRERMEVLRMAL